MTLGRVVQTGLLLLGLTHAPTAEASDCPYFTPPRYFDVSTSFCLDTSRGWVALYYPVQDTASIATTIDGGKNWRIQQLGGVGLTPISIFFFNQINGWVALFSPVQQKSSIAATVDGGEHWSIRQVDDVGYSPTSLFFLDKLHGWLMLFDTGSMHNFSCKILRTEDAGATWTSYTHETSRPCGWMRFISQQIGWVMGSSDEGDPTRLWITRNGGDTWLPYALPMPRNCEHCEIQFHEPPQFRDSRHGTFWVEMQKGSMPTGQRTLDVIYVTDNGGISWRIAKSVTEIPSF
jgi:photosystem II stability/assembly factor-like uncharacterized protein